MNAGVEKGENVRAVERALSLLSYFDLGHKILSLAELQELSGLPKSTVVRLVASLMKKGFVTKNASDNGFQLGMEVFRLGQVFDLGMELNSVAYPIMQECVCKTDETVEINIAEDEYRICVSMIEGNQILRTIVPLGTKLPIYNGASGKLLLAYMSEEVQKTILLKNKDSLEKSVDEVLTELKKIKKDGYSITFGERVSGVAGISAPIKGDKGNVIAGFTISGAVIRFTPVKIREMIIATIDCAHRISQGLGFKDMQ